jgi:hypothetical protein
MRSRTRVFRKHFRSVAASGSCTVRSAAQFRCEQVLLHFNIGVAETVTSHTFSATNVASVMCLHSLEIHCWNGTVEQHEQRGYNPCNFSICMITLNTSANSTSGWMYLYFALSCSLQYFLFMFDHIKGTDSLFQECYSFTHPVNIFMRVFWDWNWTRR